MTRGIPRPCLHPDCGELTLTGHCADHADHKPKRHRKRTQASATARGYDAAWQRLVASAKKLQPWCLDCGATEDLQGDHKPIAWERKAKGLSIRLCDIEIRCGTCNRGQGAARGEHVTR